MKAFLLMSPEQQRMQQQNPWALMADKMGFHDKGEDPMAKERIARELCNCYSNFILPYEEYYATPEGNKDIEASKHRFQQQIVQKYLSNVPTPAPNQQSPMISSAPTPHQQRKLSRTSNSVNNSPNVSSPFHNTPRQVPAPAPAPVQTAASMPPPTPVTAKSQTTKADAHILKNYTPFKRL